MSVLKGCKPRKEVLQGDLQDAIFAADFGDMIANKAPAVYNDPKTFFQNTHPAQQLRKIVETVFDRLNDPKEGGALLRLSTGFGGGKTHTLMALLHLARNIDKKDLGNELLPSAGRPKSITCIAIDAAKAGIIDAVVTAPINKTSWNLAGAKWPGHTEMFADRCKSPRKAMMFVAGPLKLALATIHEALFEVRHKFTIGCVFEPIDLLNTALKEYFNVASPKIGVAALNPHAGENGQFGDEEQRIISPAILLAQEQGINCSGPYPADTLFLRAAGGEFDGVVAMYHDQGMIPVKLLAFEDAVNVTIGIPIIRTSPAHGTAFDITGKNIANPAGMKAAIMTAIQMVRTKKGLELKVSCKKQ